MPVLMRLATTADAAPVQEIYAPIVRDTATSRSHLEALPWLVCESEGRILGYAYAGAHRTQAAYQWSVDVPVYVHTNARQIGVGRALYRSLFGFLTLQGSR